jgi:GntR family transcriptional regulator
MIFHVSPSSGVPLYLQLMEQVKHAIETGALRPGEQLPTIRAVAEELVINPNTVARAYRELEATGVIDVRHGTGAFVGEGAQPPSDAFAKAKTIARSAVERIAALGLTEDEARRLLESELTTVGNSASRRPVARHSNPTGSWATSPSKSPTSTKRFGVRRR